MAVLEGDPHAEVGFDGAPHGVTGHHAEELAVTHEEAQQKWMQLRNKAADGPVASNVPKLAEFLDYWLRGIVRPNLAPKTQENTRRLPAFISSPIWAVSCWTNYRLGMYGNG